LLALLLDALQKQNTRLLDALQTQNTPNSFFSHTSPSIAIGAQAPIGFWDPLNLLKDADQERFDRLRTVEVKHGRISMLAILGHMVTTAGYRLDGEIAYGVPFASVKNGLAALDTIPGAGIAQIIAWPTSASSSPSGTMPPSTRRKPSS
jgi:hypothetical protein